MSSLFIYHINVPWCKLIGCFLHVAHHEDSQTQCIKTKPNETLPFVFFSICIDCRQIYWWVRVRHVREPGMLHLDRSCELLCELELGLRSIGVSRIWLCCPPPWAMVNLKLTIANWGKTQVLCVTLRIILVIWSNLLTPTCSSYHYSTMGVVLCTGVTHLWVMYLVLPFDQVHHSKMGNTGTWNYALYICANNLLLYKTNLLLRKLIGCFVQVALDLCSEHPSPLRWFQIVYLRNA